MSERQLTRLFAAIERDDGAGCGPRCVSTEEIVELAEPSSRPADPERLARVAACGACSAALRVLIDLNEIGRSETDKPIPLNVLRGRAGSRRKLWWPAAALAVAATVLFLVAIQLIHRQVVGPGDRAPGDTWSAYRIEQDAVILFVEGPVRRGAGVLSPGDALPAGVEIQVSPGARLGWLDASQGELRILPRKGGRWERGRSPQLASPAFAQLARGLGPQSLSRRRLVEGLPDGVPRDRRPDFLALEPRGGVRSDRPVFKFRADLIGPDEDLILRVLDEDGIVHVEHRFRGTRTVPFPSTRAPLERGRRYVWSVCHPRSGPGPLGGEPFKVIGSSSLQALEQREQALDQIENEIPKWAVSVLRAVLLHHAGLEKEALDTLPERAPDSRLSEFVLEERALILDELGLNEQVGPVKKRLGLGTPDGQ